MAAILSLTEAEWAVYRPRDFFSTGPLCLANLSDSFRRGKVARARAFDSFLIHVARRRRAPPRNAYTRPCVKTRTFNGVSIVCDREQGRKGLATSLSLSSTSTSLALRSLAVFVFPAEPPSPRLSSCTSVYFVDRPLPAGANLRSEKLIACPSTCPCVPHFHPAPPPVCPRLLRVLVVTYVSARAYGC